MDRPIKTALLSYGMSGEVFHGPLLASIPEFELATVVKRKGETTLPDFPRVNVVRTPEEVFNDPTIELIIVNTPNATHFEYASQALEAGKHVVVEKPFTVTRKEADSLISLSSAKGVLLTAFQNRRWDGDFLTVKKVIRENMVGRIVEFEAHYDRYRNYIEAGTWKEERQQGTGIVYNLGSHMLDQVLELFGWPEYVDARIGVQRTGGAADDFYDIRLEYRNHLAIVKSSYLVREPMPRYILHGVEGSFVKWGLDPQEQDLKDKKSPLSQEWGADPEEFWGTLNTTLEGNPIRGKLRTEKGNYPAFYQNLYEAIRNGKDLAVSPQQAGRVIELIEACYESNAGRKAVKL